MYGVLHGRAEKRPVTPPNFRRSSQPPALHPSSYLEPNYALLSRLNFKKLPTFKPRLENIYSSQIQTFIFWTHLVSAKDSQDNKSTNPCCFYKGVPSFENNFVAFSTNPCCFYKGVPSFENNFVANDTFYTELTMFNIHFIVGKKLRFDKEENSCVRWTTRLQRTTYSFVFI